MQFQVPQFIERESKVIGPLTFRQFIYIGTAGGLAFLLFFALPFGLFVLAAIALGIIGLSLAFVKIGPKTMPEIILDILAFGMGPKTYIWKKGKMKQPFSKPVTLGAPADQKEQTTKVKLVRESKLKELGTKIDTRN